MTCSSRFPILASQFVFMFGSAFMFDVRTRPDAREHRTGTTNREPNPEHELRRENVEA
jgi:hypothetical protein